MQKSGDGSFFFFEGYLASGYLTGMMAATVVTVNLIIENVMSATAENQDNTRG